MQYKKVTIFVVQTWCPKIAFKLKILYQALNLTKRNKNIFFDLRRRSSRGIIEIIQNLIVTNLYF